MQTAGGTNRTNVLRGENVALFDVLHGEERAGVSAIVPVDSIIYFAKGP